MQSSESVELLDPQRGQEIIQLIMEHGGVIPLGNVASLFQVKMQQLLDAGFVFGPANAKGQRNVAPPGFPEPAAPEHIPKNEGEAKGWCGKGESGKIASYCKGLSAKGESTGKFKQVKGKGSAKAADSDLAALNVMRNFNHQEQRQLSEPVELLDPELGQEIVQFIAENGGVSSLAAIGQRFGVKKTQLDTAGFVFGPVNKAGQRNVAPPGFPEPEPPDAKGKGAQHLLLESLRPSKYQKTGTVNNSMGTPMGACGSPGTLARPMGQSMAKMMTKGMGKRKQGNCGSWQPAEPEALLDPEKGQEIIQYIMENGGVSPVAVIGARFNVKKKQLVDAGFSFGPANAKGQVNVCPPGFPPPEAPLMVLPPDPNLGLNQPFLM